MEDRPDLDFGYEFTMGICPRCRQKAYLGRHKCKEETMNETKNLGPAEDDVELGVAKAIHAVSIEYRRELGQGEKYCGPWESDSDEQHAFFRRCARRALTVLREKRSSITLEV